MPPIKSECFPLKFTPRGDKMAQVRGVGVFWILTPSAFVCRVGAEGMAPCLCKSTLYTHHGHRCCDRGVRTEGRN